MKTEPTLDTRQYITIWDNPNSMLLSQYGNTTYLRWCELEVKRMNATGGSAWVVERAGMVAVTHKNFHSNKH